MTAHVKCADCGKRLSEREAIATVGYDLFGDVEPVTLCRECYGGYREPPDQLQPGLFDDGVNP